MPVAKQAARSAIEAFAAESGAPPVAMAFLEAAAVVVLAGRNPLEEPAYIDVSLVLPAGSIKLLSAAEIPPPT